jgi:hypothetical protein
MTKKDKAPDQRIHWFDDQTQAPLIDQHARKLTSFLAAVADGRVDEHELDAQEARVYNLMKEIEPQLDDALHARVTELLCELTAYDLMQMMHQMQQSRPKTVFRG